MTDSPPVGCTPSDDGTDRCQRCDQVVTSWWERQEDSYDVPRMMVTLLPCGHVSAILMDPSS